MKIILVLLALSIYGASRLLSSFSEPDPEAPPVVAKPARATYTSSALQQFGLSSASDLAVAAAAQASGFELMPLPESGCSASVLSPQQVMDLVDRMPEGPRAMLAKALNATSSVWTAQLYRGESGVGMCLPTQGKLLKLPGLVSLPDWADSGDEVAGAVRSVGNSLSGN